MSALLDSTSHRAGFSIESSSIEVATDGGPSGFHTMLQRLIRGARRRITLASLYLGTASKEASLLDDVRYALEQSPGLTVDFMFDYSRGQRSTPNGNSVTFLASLLASYPGRVRAFLHEMPQVHRLLPSPIDELVAVFHIKAFVFDDVSILTGANLSDEYFHCRQARYIVVSDAAFADFNRRVVQVTAEHSMQILADPAGATELRDAPNDPERLASALEQCLAAMPEAPEDAETWIAPLFQHPLLGVQQEREVLCRMFASPSAELVITTPYPNFPQDYVSSLCTRLHAGPAQRTLIISPSGRSHSFTTGRGLKALVPSIYLQREWEIVSALMAASPGGTEFRHYQREGWVFHSKGAWLIGVNETSTVIGSSSFGERSVCRDYDLSFLLVSTAPKLRDRLAGEVATMLEFAGSDAPVADPKSRLARLLAPLGRSFM